MMMVMMMICLFTNKFVHLMKTQKTTTVTTTTTTTKRNKQKRKKEKKREKESKMDTMQSVWRYYMDMVLFYVWNGRLVLGAVEWHQNSSTSAFNTYIESELSSRHGRRKRMRFAPAKVENKVRTVKLDLTFVWLDLVFSRLKSFCFTCSFITSSHWLVLML